MTETLRATTVSKIYVEGIMNSMMDSLIVVTAEGQITTVNPAVCELLGREADQVLGHTLQEFMVLDGGGRVSGLIDKIVAGETVRDLEVRYLTAKRGPIPMVFAGSSMEMNSGISVV